jgi:Fe-S oxidoreductase
MAGAFGYEREHYELSMQIGELKLFPAIRKAIEAGEETIICAPGISCQSQIFDGTGIHAIHPIQLIHRLLTS